MFIANVVSTSKTATSSALARNATAEDVTFEDLDLDYAELGGELTPWGLSHRNQRLGELTWFGDVGFLGLVMFGL